MLLVHDFFPIILVHGSLFSLTEPFSIFSTDTRPSSSDRPPYQIIILDETSTTVNQIRPRSDNHIPVPHQTILRPDNQIRPSDQTVTTIADHQIRSSQQATILDYSASNQPRITSLLVQVRCIRYGLGQGGYIELWMNLAKHTIHTRSA